MANKIVELTLKLNGAETLEDMSNAARELEQELRAAGKGADGFNDAIKQLANSKSEIKQFEKDIEGLDFNQQIAGVTKFASGVVGSFALMQSAATLFGKEGSESVEKMVKTMGSLMLAMQSLTAIAEGFSGESLKSLKLIGGQFTKMVGLVKNGSLLMKRALIGTGIGAIAVALGLIIANWEKIIKVAKIALGIEKDLTKEAEKRIKYNQDILALTEQRAKIIDEIAKLSENETQGLKTQYDLSYQNYKILLDQALVQSQILANTERDLEKRGLGNRLAAGYLKYLTLGIFKKKGQQVVDDKLLKNEQERIKAQQELSIISDKLLLNGIKMSTAENELISLAFNHGKNIQDNVKWYQEVSAAIAAGALGTTEQLEIQKRLVQAAEQHRDLDNDAIRNLKQQNDLLGLEKENEAEIYNNKLAALNIEIANRESIIGLTKALVDNEKEVVQAAVYQYEQDLKRFKILDEEGKLKKEERVEMNAALLNNKAILDALQGQLDAKESIVKNAQRETQVLIDQQEILIEAEKIRKREQAIADFKYNRELALNKLLADQAITTEKINLYMAEQQQEMNAIYRVTELQTQELDKQQQAVDLITQGFEDYISTYDSLNNAADIYSGKLQDFVDTTVDIGGGIRVTAQAYEELIGLQALDNEQLELSVTYYTHLLEMQNQRIGKQDEDIQLAAQQLALASAISDATIKQLEAQEKALLTQRQGQQEILAVNKAMLTDSQNAITAKEQELVAEQSYVKELQKRGVKGRELAEERDASALRQKKLEEEILKLKQKVVDADNNIVSAENEIEETEKQINNVNIQINKELEKRENKHKRINQQLQQELKMNDKIADWWAKNAESAQGVVDILAAGMDMIGVGFQNTITTLSQAYQQYMLDSQAHIDQLRTDLDVLNDEYNNQRDNLDELYKLREDADGERLAAIDAEIAALEGKNAVEVQLIKDKENALIRAQNQQKLEEVKYKNQLAQAEHKNAKWQKATNIINAVSQGVLAVLKSAPNPIMMAISGVLAAASVATIAAQKIPQPLVYPAPQLVPEIKAEGGMVVGDSHAAPSGGVPILAEGGEWIAPKWMMRHPDTAPVIQQLEAVRTRRYAEGGEVQKLQPMVAEVRQSSMIDYDMLAEKLASMNIWVSVAEIKDVDRQFTKVVYEGSSI